MKEFINIPSSSLKVINSIRKEDRKTVSFFYEGTVSLTSFAIMQLLHGAKISIEQFINEIEKVHGVEFMLYYKLSKYLLEAPQESYEIELSRTELLCLKKWLEFRMIHCEKERDVRNPKFNPDTYIGQKLLLIDLRELLLGEIME